MKILGIETSSYRYSLSLHDGAALLRMMVSNRDVPGSPRDGGIFSLLKDLLAGPEARDLRAIAVAIGPGMFTALRVGIGIAKGVALSRGIPVVGVSSLDAMGLPLSRSLTPLIVTTNAYHGEAYAAVYDRGALISGHVCGTPDEIRRRLTGKGLGVRRRPVYLVGSGCPVLTSSPAFAPGPRFRPLVFPFLAPTSAEVVAIAVARIDRGEYDDLDRLEPCYIRATDAERCHH